ncbi:unnamed protein product [Clonostachys rosea f. rosea IK726]|jgi:NADH dehydrogenase FAD-containing subunit|uniref:FAD/NAD(P)-binding domain-containing protein n=2 Tax=Bionectria ochroleuca TaxID=29856 RepID=A0A0B7JYN7_BIOOC|nr:unnamed protein product [Clonostachys rosea f. rosea IK726]
MKNIVVLGAGLGAIPVIRNAMKDIVLSSKDYKLIVVAPNTHFHYPIAMPRVIVPGQIPDDKVFLPLDSLFKSYPAEKFEFLVGEAKALAPADKTITVSLNAGEERSVTYDALIIATGASSRDSMPWKTVGTTEKTKEEVKRIREEIKNAKTIVVAGGGLTGSETAGELGFEYGKSGKKEIYFVHSDAQPLYSHTLDSVRKQVRIELEKMKVKLISNSTVTSTKRDGSDITVEILNQNGETRTIKAQAYIPATGVAPNSGFAPKELLDERGYFKQTKTLQLEGHSDIFVVGDVGNKEPSKAMITEAQANHVIKALPGFILRKESVPEYKPADKEMAAVTLGRSKGTGQMGTMKLPSFMVWFLKGRSMFVEKVPAFLVAK